MKPTIEIIKEKNDLCVTVKLEVKKYTSQKIVFFTTKDLMEELENRNYEIKELLENDTNIIANIQSKGYKQVAFWRFSLKRKTTRAPRKKNTAKKT